MEAKLSCLSFCPSRSSHAVRYPMLIHLSKPVGDIFSRRFMGLFITKTKVYQLIAGSFILIQNMKSLIIRFTCYLCLIK